MPHAARCRAARRSPTKAFSGGLTFTTPVFIATAPNITPDVETGIGSWSDAEIKRALVEGMRPDHGHLAGVPLAAIMPANFYKALLPDDLDAIVAYLRTVKPIRSEVPDPVYKAPVHRDPYPDAEAGFSKAMFTDPVRRGAYLRHHRPLHGVPLRMVARRVGFQKWTGPRRQGFPAACRDRRMERPTASPPTSPPIRPPASAPGAMPKSAAPLPMALPATDIRSGRRWPSAYYAGLKQADLADIIAYLRTVPPLQ